jgi:hypothetical protein
MVLDWLLLILGLFGFVFLVTRATVLADRPRRGTSWHPSRRGWLMISLAPLLVAIGACLNLLA